MLLNAFVLCLSAVISVSGMTGSVDKSYSEITDERIKPIIINPEEGKSVYSEDSLVIRYYARQDADGYMILSDEDGIVNISKIHSGSVFYNSENTNTRHIIGEGGIYLLDEKYLEPEKEYSLRMVSDLIMSEPVYFSTYTGGQEVIKNILERKSYNPLKLPIERVAPIEFFKSSKTASSLMETITVKVWKIDEEGNKYPTTERLTVNKNLKSHYINIFNEIFALGFPIKSLGCYNYRNTHGGRLSEHALGTAVDINPMENYCIYSDGTKVGYLYEPLQNPYSVTPEVVNVFKKYGFAWGGDWGSTPDYMHFSYFET